MKHRILWLTDSSIPSVLGLRNWLSEHYDLTMVSDLTMAIDTFVNRGPFHLCLVGLSVPAGNRMQSQDFNTPYDQHGLNFINYVRRERSLPTPVALFSLAPPNTIQNARLDLNINWVISLEVGFNRDEIIKVIESGIELSNILSDDIAQTEDDPLVFKAVHIESTCMRLGLNDKEKVLSAIQTASRIGGNRLTSRILRVIQRFNSDVEVRGAALLALLNLHNKGLWSRSIFEEQKDINSQRLNNIYRGASTPLTSIQNFGNIGNLNVGSGTQFNLLASSKLADLLNTMEELVQARQLTEGRSELSEDWATVKNWILNDSDEVDNVQKISVLERLKSQAPELQEHFLTITSGAFGNVVAAGILYSIKLVFGG